MGNTRGGTDAQWAVQTDESVPGADARLVRSGEVTKRGREKPVMWFSRHVTLHMEKTACVFRWYDGQPEAGGTYLGCYRLYKHGSIVEKKTKDGELRCVWRLCS